MAFMNFRLYAFLVALLVLGCSKQKKQASFAGGKISLCIESIDLNQQPESLTDYNTQMVLSQVFESLVSLDTKELTVKPQLAKKIDVKNDGQTYEFTLRDNVYFHDFGDSKSDRLLTPEDVVYSIEKACKKREGNIPSAAYSITYQQTLKGADEFHEGKAEKISGVRVKGNKVILDLIRKDNNFLDKLSLVCCAVQSRKLANSGELLIGTGPFTLMPENTDENRIQLIKNEDYYAFDKKGNALPYLDSLEFILNTKKLQQLDMFEKYEVDLILGLPTSRITKMLEGRLDDFNSKPPIFVLHNNPQLVTNYYFFDLSEPRFQDKRVRQAFNYAVDKSKIGQNLLQNQYYELGNYGIIPPIQSIFRGYDFDAIEKNGYAFDPIKAKALLAAAGYPNGEGFGSINLRFNINDVHSAVADEFAKQIKRVLNINVNIDGSTFEQLQIDGDKGNGDIFRSAWAADYPSEESFLINFYGKLVPKNPNELSIVNQSRYRNSLFDQYLEKAQRETKITKKREYFALAELELIKDPPIIPLWYNGELEIVYSHVRNLNVNPLDLFIFKEVYIKEWTPKEYRDYMKKKS
jgi:oligopeptide transport system substrate-binding protein|tara:strand:- start:25190 stop:26923 length:1734 start_codon:yes stop_codon:yes gene_type:complete